MRNVTGIPININVDSFKYTIGREKFDKITLSEVCSDMQGKWIISVDEAIVDEESFVGEVAYRHSCAFGYKIPIPKDNPDERILAVSSILRLQDEVDFDRKMEFLPYIYKEVSDNDGFIITARFACRKPGGRILWRKY
jgi:hypothetical protein